MEVESDWVNRLWRIGAIEDAQCFSMNAGILSGPVAFVMSRVSNSFCMPSVVIVSHGMVGYGLFGMLGN